MTVGGLLYAYYPTQIPSTEVQASILQALPSGPPVTISELEPMMPQRYPRSSVRYALRLLVEDGRVEKRGSRLTTRYSRYRRRPYDPGPMGANRLFARKWRD